MKLPLALSLVILAAGTFWGAHENQHLATLREQHRLVVEEAAALGVSLDLAQPLIATKAGQRPRRDDGQRAMELAGRLIAFAKEMKAFQESGKQMDTAAQKRIMDLLDGLLSFNSGELKILIDELKVSQELDDEMRQGMISFSIVMLAQQHPEAAIALFTESSDLLDKNMRQRVLRAALFQWAKEQPLAATEWIKKNAGKFTELVTYEAKQAIIAGAAHNDFALALQLIGELKLSHLDGGLMSTIAQAATTPEQRTEFLNALRKQPDTTANPAADSLSLHAAGLRSLFSQIAGAGYDQSMDWIQSADLSRTETASLVESLNYDLTKGNTGKWLDWIATQPAAGNQAEATTRNLVHNWTEKDYKAAGEWLAQSPAGPTKEAATLSYLETIAPYEPDAAAQWAATLPAAKQKGALQAIYQTLERKDKAAAEAFAARHGLDD